MALTTQKTKAQVQKTITYFNKAKTQAQNTIIYFNKIIASQNKNNRAKHNSI
jgi:hypothetical protein